MRFLLAVFEVARFYLAYVYQGFEAEVHFAEAYVELAGKLTLTDVGVGFNQFHDFVAVFVGEHLVSKTRMSKVAEFGLRYVCVVKFKS